MKTREALKVETASFDPLTAASSLGGLAVSVVAILVCAAGVFATLAKGSDDALLLTALAVFAMLGLFFVLGVAAGHIRIGGRVDRADVASAAVSHLADPILIARRDGAAVYCNAAFEHAFGVTDAGPLAAIEALTPGRTEAGRALYRLMRAAEAGQSLSEELIVEDVSGAERVFRVDVRSLTSLSTGLSAILSGGPDGSERREFIEWHFADLTAERARARAETRLLEKAMRLVDGAPVGLMTVDASGVIAHVNGSFQDWLGRTGDSIVGGQTRFAEIAGADAVELLAELARSSERDHRSIELDLTRKDGRVVPLTLYVDPSDHGFTLAAIPRGRTMGPTGPDRARGTQVFDSAPFGIATLDAEGRIATANTAFLRMMPGPSSVIDAVALDVVAATADREERDRMAGAIEKVLTGRAVPMPIDLSAGDQRQLARRIYAAPLAADRGHDAAVLFVVDTTEQKQLEARFAQAQKMEAVGTLAGGIAHDFNNVLTAIIGISDLLLQNRRPTDPDYKDIRSIQSAAKRAADLVANLLGFSRKQTQRVTALNLGELASENANVLKIHAGEKIDLKFHSERDLWYVKADGSQIFNVVLNLIKNARDAMPDGGALSIRTRNVPERESLNWIDKVGAAPGEYVAIEVADTGTGMSQDVMDKVFEPFFTTKGVGKGTGLGLASVYGIVKQSGGYILPESVMGEGTTFKVYLPRFLPETEDEVQAPAILSETPRRPAKASDLTGTGRVLLVEDEVEVRQFAVRALKRQGYQVVEASDGVEALEAVDRGEDVDIVVSDVMMPEMDGPTLFKELRKRNPSMKVIFVSGYPNEAFREQLGSEDFAFLPKPFSLPDLAQKVKDELAR